MSVVKSAMMSGNTSTLSLYDARLLPFWVIMLVVPTVLRQYTLMLLTLSSRLKMLVWQFSGPPLLEQDEGKLGSLSAGTALSGVGTMGVGW
jgi:hypothetical protein